MTADPHLHAAAMSEVPPPLLTLGPPDVHDHPVAILVVADREGVAATSATSGDRDQGELSAQQGMERRAEQSLQDWIASPVEDRERGVAPAHLRDGTGEPATARWLAAELLSGASPVSHAVCNQRPFAGRGVEQAER
jgi:hypothetical protein